jgi:YD repeat-containing protein
MTERTEFRRRFDYDERDQLVAVEDDQGWRIEYEYDPSGNRTRRKISATGVRRQPENPPG